MQSGMISTGTFSIVLSGEGSGNDPHHSGREERRRGEMST